jgi:hypothetical protein
MVADAQEDGNQTGFPSPGYLLQGGIFVQLDGPVIVISSIGRQVESVVGWVRPGGRYAGHTRLSGA